MRAGHTRRSLLYLGVDPSGYLPHPLTQLAANWDKTQTLSQNYRRLGLTAKLNKNTGGVEKTAEDVEKERQEGLHNDGSGRRKDAAMTIASRRRPERLDVREARIERDAKTGHIQDSVHFSFIVRMSFHSTAFHFLVFHFHAIPPYYYFPSYQ